MNWHHKGQQETYSLLGSSSEGLTFREADNRIQKYGLNEIRETEKKTLFMMFLDQFRDFMILVLIAAAVISGIIGEMVDTIAIVVIVVLNAIIGFIQEFRAERAMKALMEMAAPEALVLREGERLHVPAATLVPGDVVVLEAGRIVPADIRIVESVQLRVEEAALTGESVPVEKSVDALQEESVPLGDRTNMAYKGTTVSYGRGRGIVVETGMNTELGKIAVLLQQEDEVKTPLQKRLAAFGQRLGMAVLGICAIVFIAGLLRGETPLLMFLTAISLAVAAIPEALPAVVTISLAIGAKKMVKQNALVRKLPAVETLGSVTYICSDKTGTLTLNKMTVEEIYVAGELTRLNEMSGNLIAEKREISETPMKQFMTALALSNDAVFDKEGSLIGDPTEIALSEIAARQGFTRKELEKDFPRTAEIPFDSERKCMTTFHKKPGGGVISFTKGALESVLTRCRRVLLEEGPVEMDRDAVGLIDRANEKMADDGLRTLAFALRQWENVPEKLLPEEIEKDLTFIGLSGLMDPPRDEAREAVRICKNAGIKPVMITGDHPLTARNIARRLGIIDSGEGIMTGPELEKLSLEEFEKSVDTIRVYARVAPEQKIKIVRALQDKGEFAAMTGDGVNDAPALKRADIGVAMGITGTDVSKESAHMILLDDNFATIVKAVKEGRRIFDNIRKFIRYTMTSNSGEIWTIFLAPFLGLPIPLLPIHILWVNLVTDGLPGLAYAMEPAGKNVMNRPPRHPQENIFTGMWAQIIWIGLLMGGVTIITQAWAISQGYDQARWQTMVFTVLCLSQMGNAFSLRSERQSFFKLGMFSNMAMFWAVSLTFVLQMAVIYVPVLNPVFKTAPLDGPDLLFTLAISCVVFIAAETEKWWFRSTGK